MIKFDKNYEKYGLATKTRLKNYTYNTFFENT